MQASLILGQRMAGYFIDETLQALAPILDEVLIEDAVVAAERHLALPCFAWQRRNNNLRNRRGRECKRKLDFPFKNAFSALIIHLTVSLQLVSKPLKVTVTSSHTRFLHFEYGQIGLCTERETKRRRRRRKEREIKSNYIIAAV